MSTSAIGSNFTSITLRPVAPVQPARTQAVSEVADARPSRSDAAGQPGPRPTETLSTEMSATLLDLQEQATAPAREAEPA